MENYLLNLLVSTLWVFYITPWTFPVNSIYFFLNTEHGLLSPECLPER